MIAPDLMPQAGDELGQHARHASRLVDRRALRHADAEPAVKAVPPQVVLAEDVPDMAGIGFAGGKRGEESTLREQTGRVRFEAFRNDPAIGWHNAPRQP